MSLRRLSKKTTVVVNAEEGAAPLEDIIIPIANASDAQTSPPDDSDDSSSSSDSSAQSTGNEGETSDEDVEVPAGNDCRGWAGLVTAACPRRYPRSDLDRQKLKRPIPADFTNEAFLKKFRRTFDTVSTKRIEMATVHDEPHKRFRKSNDRRERHKHIAFKTNGPFAHKKLADSFYREHGLQIHFSFKLMGFASNLRYLMTIGKKTSTDIDTNPAKYPPNLDLQKIIDMASSRHLDPAAPAKKVRTRLSFDDFSNIVVEGIGSGPLRTIADLEAAALSLKRDGKVELWNYLGAFKTAADSKNQLMKVWRLLGNPMGDCLITSFKYKVDDFDLSTLPGVRKWLGGEYATRVLVLSGDGCLGKTGLAKASYNSLIIARPSCSLRPARSQASNVK